MSRSEAIEAATVAASIPTTEGYYWWRKYQSANWVVVSVVREAISGTLIMDGWSLERQGGEWSERIHEPKGIPSPPEPDSELAELRAENERLRLYESAMKEWLDKTEWVQQSDLGNGGEHRADIMRDEIERLRAELVTVKRHWIEDDRDLNELIAENDQLRQRAEQAEALLRECGAAWQRGGMLAHEVLDKLPKPE